MAPLSRVLALAFIDKSPTEVPAEKRSGPRGDKKSNNQKRVETR
jgi:hypothetical protein